MGRKWLALMSAMTQLIFPTAFCGRAQPFSPHVRRHDDAIYGNHSASNDDRLRQNPAADHNSAVRTLVIVTSQPRGGEAAWRSLQEHVLQSLNADLATFFTDKHQGTLLQSIAAHNWACPEYADWSFALDDIAATCGRSRQEWISAFCTSRLDKQWWLGGATPDCKQEGPQAAGLLWVYRWFVQQKIVQLRLDERYDYFVLTRPDQLYLCDHVPVTSLDRSTLWVVEGENYGGWTDRHIVGHRDIFLKAMSATFRMFCNPKYYGDLIHFYIDAGLAVNGDFMNIETLQKMMWQDMDVPVRTIPRSMFTVRHCQDPSRWSQGEEHASLQKYGLKVKYPDELQTARMNCAVDLDDKLGVLHGAQARP